MKIILKILFLLAMLLICGIILYVGGIIILLATQHGPIQYMFTDAILWITVPIMIGITYLIWIIIQALFKGPE